MSFDPIKPADYPCLKKYFSHQKYRLCVYSLPSLISWSNDIYQPYGLIDGEALLISAEWRIDQKENALILPISPAQEFPPKALHDLSVRFGTKRFTFVPDNYIKEYGRLQVETFFNILPQKDYDDYVYRTQDLAQLKGNRYSKKRNLINQFKREYDVTKRIQTENISASTAVECIQFLDAWCEDRNCDLDRDQNLACEYKAAVNMVENIDKYDVFTLLLRIDDAVCAFAVGSALTADMGVLHFEKALASIKGLYQYFDRLCARLLFKDYKYINKESDMGEEGLAKAKKSYLPEMMIKSYQLIPHTAKK